MIQNDRKTPPKTIIQFIFHRICHSGSLSQNSKFFEILTQKNANLYARGEPSTMVPAREACRDWQKSENVKTQQTKLKITREKNLCQQNQQMEEDAHNELG